MPSATKIKEFIRAVRERKSAIAVKLDKASEKCVNNDGFRAKLNGAIGLWQPAINPLPYRASDNLADLLDLDNHEVDHINAWRGKNSSWLPALHGVAQTATAAPVTAPPMEFFWEIDFDGPAAGPPLSDQVIDPAVTPIKVTFISPRQNVKTKVNLLAANIREVEVDI